VKTSMGIYTRIKQCSTAIGWSSWELFVFFRCICYCVVELHWSVLNGQAKECLQLLVFPWYRSFYSTVERLNNCAAGLLFWALLEARWNKCYLLKTGTNKSSVLETREVSKIRHEISARFLVSLWYVFFCRYRRYNGQNFCSISINKPTSSVI
jgi:hypothetical protein